MWDMHKTKLRLWHRRDRMAVGFTTTICNRYLIPLKLWVRTPLMSGVLETTLYDKVCQWQVGGFKVCQWLVSGRLFSPGTLVFSIKTYCHDITEILLKVALNTINLNLLFFLLQKNLRNIDLYIYACTGTQLWLWTYICSI